MSQLQRLRFKHYLSFGLGDYAFNLFFQGTTLFLLFFYTDILGIKAATAGAIFLVATIWDAITDPVMGYLAGKTRSRWGRYRPYLLIMPIPLGVTYMLMFYQPNLSGTTLIIWAAALQILFRTAFTLGNIPYSSLSSEMTFNPNERSQLAAYRMFLGYGGALTVSYLTGKFMAAMNWTPAANGYFKVGLVFAILGVILFYITFRNTFELPHTASKSTIRPRAIWQMISANRPFITLCLMVMLGMAAVVLFYQALSYYFKYNLNQGAALGSGMLCLFTFLMLSLPGWFQLSKRIGKRDTLIAGCLVLLVGSLTFYLNPLAKTNIYWVYAHMSLIGTGIGCSAFSFWGMLPDTVEYGEWKSGVRAEAVIFGLGLFFLKIGLGLGSFVLGIGLDLMGYQPNQAQTVTTLSGIHALTTLGVAIPFLGILLLMLTYTLTIEKYNLILSELKLNS